MTKCALGAGRSLPDLLFATDPDRLRANVGGAADEAINLIQSAGKTLFEVSDSPDVWEKVAEASRAHDGVVLVGGHDVLRLKSTNALPDSLRRALTGLADLDAFIVWNDDCYGDIDGDHAAEMPVTRIPDGHDGNLLIRALSATPGSPPHGRFGLRNVARPYALDIFSRVVGIEEMIASEPTACSDGSAAGMGARRLYLVLHGQSDDCTSMFGEAGGIPLKALSVDCVPEIHGGTVLMGACYGALTVDKTALEDPQGGLAMPLKRGGSIALELLAQGALAVIGCTGTHYSPVEPAFDEIGMCFTGAPIHEFFWRNVQAGRAPAVALYQAKIDYLGYLPYCRSDDRIALNLKHWRQFTCLGLGW